MRTKAKIITSVVILVSIFIYSCKEEIEQISGGKNLENPSVAVISAPCVPHYNTPDEISENMDWLAIALAKFGQDGNSTVNPLQFRRDVEGELNQDNEVFMSVLISQSDEDNFSTPITTPPNSMHSAMDHEMSSSTNMPPTTIPTWDNCLYEIFEWSTDKDLTAVYVEIRDYDLYVTNDPAHLDKQLMVIAAWEGRDISATGINGYYWNPSSSSIKEYHFNDFEELDDFIDAGTYCVWRLDVESISTSYNRNTWSCETGAVCDDGFCDLQCGENVENCPQDCNSNYGRKVTLDKFKILSTVNNSDFHNTRHKFYDKIGKYEVGFGAVIAHGPGNARIEHTTMIKVRPKVKRRDVKRYKYKNSGDLKSGYPKKSNKEYSNIWEKGEDENKKPSVTKLFNPYTDRIYILFYEHDWGAGLVTSGFQEVKGFTDPLDPNSNVIMITNSTTMPWGRWSGSQTLVNPKDHDWEFGDPFNGPVYTDNWNKNVVEIKPSDWVWDYSGGPLGVATYTFDGALGFSIPHTNPTLKDASTFSFTLRCE